MPVGASGLRFDTQIMSGSVSPCNRHLYRHSLKVWPWFPAAHVTINLGSSGRAQAGQLSPLSMCAHREDHGKKGRQGVSAISSTRTGSVDDAESYSVLDPRPFTYSRLTVFT